MKTTPFVLLAALLVPAAVSAQHGGHGAATPYAGLQSREIKALLALYQRLRGYAGENPDPQGTHR